jgi:hypothetical protein
MRVDKNCGSDNKVALITGGIGFGKGIAELPRARAALRR